MGTPIRIHRDVARTMRENSAAWNNVQAVLLCPGDDARWDECPAVYGFMLSRALDLRIADGRSTLLLPQSNADMLLVLAPGAETAIELLPAFADPLPALDIQLREEAGRYRFYRLPSGQTPSFGNHAPARLANGVELLSFDFAQPPRPDRAARLVLWWRVLEVPAEPPLQGYSFANHLLSAGNTPEESRRVAQADGPGHPVALWRSGDTLISTFEIALSSEAPPPPYRLRTGMYVYTPPDQFVTIPVVDAQGAPIGNAAEWDLP
jgi:hypothetical protein